MQVVVVYGLQNEKGNRQTKKFAKKFEFLCCATFTKELCDTVPFALGKKLSYADF